MVYANLLYLISSLSAIEDYLAAEATAGLERVVSTNFESAFELSERFLPLCLLALLTGDYDGCFLFL